MAQLTRVYQQVFGSLAGLNQIAKYGSLAAGSPAFTTDPAQIQTANYLSGWFGAVLGNNSPAMEDMNALFYLYAYQLSYLMQDGIPEWDTSTTYYTGSFVKSGSVVYVSRTDSNQGNAVSVAANWKKVGGDIMSALGDVIYGGVNGAQTRLAGNTSATPYFLTQTGTGSVSAAPAWRQFIAPTIQKFTSSSGTYTTPAGVLYIRVRAVGGGGGGGGGAGTGGSGAGSGGSGGNTTFGTSLLVANGGGGAGQTTGGTGGSASLGTGPIGIAIPGAVGQGINVAGIGGSGAGTALAGGGGGGQDSSSTTGTGSTGSTNSGVGGGGAGGTASAGAGGGAGGFVDAIIASPSATYAYAVGAAGTAGSAGTGGSGGSAGGAGAAGVIEVTEYYQ